MFSFKGPIAGSKSLWNRALIVQSFFTDLNLGGDGDAADILRLRESLQGLKRGESQFDCGDGGTTFRFLLARLSREEGEFRVSGSSRLFQRPHQDLYQALQALGCEVHTSQNVVTLHAKGWSDLESLEISLATSSQFLSALLLSSWSLPSPLLFKTDWSVGSASYLEMTLQFLKSMGMQWERQDNAILVPRGQTSSVRQHLIEPDMSSAFVVAALAIAGGRAEILGFPTESLQPDFAFVTILQNLGAKIEQKQNVLIVEKSVLKGGNFDLRNTPDLFPVLAILLARAEGDSVLTGLESLPHKESNRIEKTHELILKLGGQAHWDGKRFRIVGVPKFEVSDFAFDPDQDHRMAMAAAVANLQGAKAKVLNPDVVNKSFPNFWKLL